MKSVSKCVKTTGTMQSVGQREIAGIMTCIQSFTKNVSLFMRKEWLMYTQNCLHAGNSKWQYIWYLEKYWHNFLIPSHLFSYRYRTYYTAVLPYRSWNNLCAHRIVWGLLFQLVNDWFGNKIIYWLDSLVFFFVGNFRYG